MLCCIAPTTSAQPSRKKRKTVPKKFPPFLVVDVFVWCFAWEWAFFSARNKPKSGISQQKKKEKKLKCRCCFLLFFSFFFGLCCVMELLVCGGHGRSGYKLLTLGSERTEAAGRRERTGWAGFILQERSDIRYVVP